MPLIIVAFSKAQMCVSEGQLQGELTQGLNQDMAQQARPKQYYGPLKVCIGKSKQ